MLSVWGPVIGCRASPYRLAALLAPDISGSWFASNFTRYSTNEGRKSTGIRHARYTEKDGRLFFLSSILDLFLRSGLVPPPMGYAVGTLAMLSCTLRRPNVLDLTK